jgi:hypothetical protein
MNFNEPKLVHGPVFGKHWSTKGSSINDVTVLGGRRYQGFCDNSTKALVMKSVTMGRGPGVSKMIEYCVTSFMDDPLLGFLETRTTRMGWKKLVSSKVHTPAKRISQVERCQGPSCQLEKKFRDDLLLYTLRYCFWWFWVPDGPQNKLTFICKLRSQFINQNLEVAYIGLYSSSLACELVFDKNVKQNFFFIPYSWFQNSQYFCWAYLIGPPIFQLY